MTSLAAVVTLKADVPWGYSLGTERQEQQGNFCNSLDATLQIAEVFETQGPRPGYAALDSSPECELKVLTFTPRGIVSTVVLGKGEETEYTVHFVEIINDEEDTYYMVTTRKVTP